MVSRRYIFLQITENTLTNKKIIRNKSPKKIGPTLTIPHLKLQRQKQQDKLP